MSEDWPFPARPDAPVLTGRGVAFLGRPVLLVLHDPEGDWQMLSEGAASDRAHVLGLGTLVRRDPSLRALADLPRGWIARRRGPDAPWERIAPGEAPATATQPDAGRAVAPVHTSGQVSGGPDAPAPGPAEDRAGTADAAPPP